jgi:hypothetical protein
MVVSTWEELRQTLFLWVVGSEPGPILAVYGILGQFIRSENLSDILMMLYNIHMKEVEVYFGEDGFDKSVYNECRILQKWIKWIEPELDR